VIDDAGGRSLLLIDETATDDASTGDGRDQLLDIALGPAMLAQVAVAGGPELLRVYRPRPTLAFSGRDCAAAGIGRAVDAARAAGFAPVRRGPGGRAAGYHRGALCLDHVGPDAAGVADIRPRFAAFGELLAGALRSLGVDAAVGPVPGEYCPGEFSINDCRGHKLVGTAQRLVRGGWLFGTVILVTDPEPVRDVLTDVYRALELDWDPETVGAMTGTAPGITVADARAAVLRAYEQLGPLVPGQLAAETIDLARSRADRHLVPRQRASDRAGTADGDRDRPEPADPAPIVIA
jgi:lipoate-protein ligase A